MTELFILFVGIVVRILMAALVAVALGAPIVLGLAAWRRYQAMRRTRAHLEDLDGVDFRNDAAYTPRHVWLLPDRFGDLRVGLDALARRLFSEVRWVSLPQRYSRVTAGEVIARVITPEGEAEVQAPLDGVVVEINDRLRHRPSLLASEPYGRGWLFRIAPTNRDWKDFAQGDEARRFLTVESKRLDRLFEAELGFAAADGGSPVRPLPALLKPEAWTRVVREILAR